MAAYFSLSDCTNATSTTCGAGSFIYYAAFVDGTTAATTTCCTSSANSSIYVYCVPYVGTGTSCTANTITPNHVTQAMVQPRVQPQITEEERERLRVLREEQQRQAAEERRQREAAMGRAKSLLLEHLNEHQRETFERNGWFVVEGGKSKKQYRINPAAHAGNVTEMNGDKPAHSYCAHIPYQFPSFDNALAQKLALEVDEHAFLKVANKRAA